MPLHLGRSERGLHPPNARVRIRMFVWRFGRVLAVEPEPLRAASCGVVSLSVGIGHV